MQRVLGLRRSDMTRCSLSILVCTAVIAAACSTGTGGSGSSASTGATAADTKTFLDSVNETMGKLDVEQNQAGWVAENFITDDTEAINAKVTQRVTDAIARFAKESTKYDRVDVPADQ